MVLIARIDQHQYSTSILKYNDDCYLLLTLNSKNRKNTIMRWKGTRVVSYQHYLIQHIRKY
jgi:hypothetical protein